MTRNPLFALTILLFALSSAEAKQPNILFIFADDQAFDTIRSLGNDEIETPNLDRLASGGLRFTQFYNYGRCCPTRAALMTGLHPHQVGIGHMTEPPSRAV